MVLPYRIVCNHHYLFKRRAILQQSFYHINYCIEMKLIVDSYRSFRHGKRNQINQVYRHRMGPLCCIWKCCIFERVLRESKFPIRFIQINLNYAQLICIAFLYIFHHFCLVQTKTPNFHA